MRKILGILLALSLALFLPVPALAASGVTYLDYNAETGEFDPQTKAAGDYTVVTGSTTAWSAGWYVVSGNVTINGNIRVTGSSDLILTDNSTLTVIGSIIVPSSRRLTIYAQSTGDDAGKLIAIGKQQYQAGIGGGNNSGIGSITINGGVVTATGGQYGAGIGGSYTTTTAITTSGQVTINGGVVTATGGQYGAGIGSGYGSKASVSVTVTINGGAVTATGGERGAGIGGGDIGAGTVTINGGVVEAKGEDGGAGIGGGKNGSGTVTITGGTVTSTGGTGAAGIGGGYTNTSTSNVTISGGFVTATGGGSNGAAIGKGSIYGTDNGTEVAESNFTNAVVLRQSGSATTMTGTVYGDPTLTTDATVPNGITLTIPAGSTLTIDGDATLTNNGTITVGDTLKNDSTIVNNGTINGTVTGSGRIIVDGNIVIDENTTNKTGTASLAHEVAPAYTVTIPSGVTIGNTATVEAENVRVDYGKQVVVRLSGSAFTVALEGDTTETLDYTVSAGGQKVAAGDAVLTVNPANATGDALAGGSAELAFALADTAVVKYSGSYTGTVTFTVSVETVPTGGTG